MGAGPQGAGDCCDTTAVAEEEASGRVGELGSEPRGEKRRGRKRVTTKSRAKTFSASSSKKLREL